MHAFTVRLVGVLVLVVGLFLTNLPSARADVWGARKWTATNLSYPDECLHIGLYIATTVNPDKHNVESVNSCASNLTVDIALTEFDSNNVAIVHCFQSNGNRAHCELQHSTDTSKPQWWYWEATMHSTEDFKSCSEFGAAYASCFRSAD